MKCSVERLVCSAMDMYVVYGSVELVHPKHIGLSLINSTPGMLVCRPPFEHSSSRR